jgi:hypothetical protein
MKTVFEKSTRDELVARISALQEGHRPLWGKMTAAQMVRHCAQWDDMAMGRRKYRQSFIGKLFGKMALKDMMKDQPMKKNLPTVPSFKITEQPDLAEEKKKWILQLEDYARFSNDNLIHPFFGKLSKEQTGVMVYKHAHHHLRQFNV